MRLTLKAAEDKFLELLAELFTHQGRAFSDNPRAGNYAPKMFAGQPDAGFNKMAFEAAMNRLLKVGAIKVVPHGKPSSNTTKIVPAGWVEPKEPEKVTPADKALMALEQAIVAHGVDRDGHVYVTIDQWRTAAYAAGITESNNPATQRQAFNRAQKVLKDDGSIGIDGDLGLARLAVTTPAGKRDVTGGAEKIGIHSLSRSTAPLNVTLPHKPLILLRK